MAKAEDLGNYFCVPCDNRDLNYEKYLAEGQHKLSTTEDYHSHNTYRLDVTEMKALLQKVKFIKEDLNIE